MYYKNKPESKFIAREAVAKRYNNDPEITRESKPYKSVVKELRRSYCIKLKDGGIIFKNYTPSELKKITDEKNKKTQKWESVKQVGCLTWPGNITSPKTRIQKNRGDYDFYRW